MPDDAAPKLHIDSDWKAEAQREKERLAAKEQTQGTGGKPAKGAMQGEGELPEASFKSLVGMLASQAIMGLGAVADQQTGRVIVDLEGARFAIDLLDVLEQKTKGNLAADEAKELTGILAELRARYVQINQLVARQLQQQAAAGPAGPVAGGSPMPPLRS